MAHVGCPQSQGLKLFGREVIFEEFQLMRKTYLNVTDGQTDGRTDNIRSQYHAMHIVHRAVKITSKTDGDVGEEGSIWGHKLDNFWYITAPKQCCYL